MTELITAIVAFFGGALGSGLAYRATYQQTRVEREARRREEWGRRFTSALEAINSTDPVSRATGRALLVELLDSPLAAPDDRRAAEAVLDAAATHSTANLRLLLRPDDVDDVNVVRDTGDNGETEGGPR